jgi:hypothetical protein
MLPRPIPSAAGETQRRPNRKRRLTFGDVQLASKRVRLSRLDRTDGDARHAANRYLCWRSQPIVVARERYLTGVSRRRSRVRVPSLPSCKVPAARRLSLPSQASTRVFGATVCCRIRKTGHNATLSPAKRASRHTEAKRGPTLIPGRRVVKRLTDERAA